MIVDHVGITCADLEAAKRFYDTVLATLGHRRLLDVGVAVGYKDGESWVTEGWWNVGAASCETLLKGPLVARYYYVYALDYDKGGEWSGDAFMCTREREFTIRGVEDCLARGFDRSGFFEVDTGEQKTWTIQLTDPSRTGAAP